MAHKCCFEGCNDKGTKMPELVLYAHKHHQPATAVVPVYACDAHATDEAAQEFMETDEQRQAIRMQFLAAGKMAPDFKLSYVHWVDVADGECRIVSQHRRCH